MPSQPLPAVVQVGASHAHLKVNASLRQLQAGMHCMYMLHSVTAVALKSWMRCVRKCNNLSPRHTSSDAATPPLHVTTSPRPLQVGHTPLHTESWRGLTSSVSLLIADPHKDVILLRKRVRGCVVGSLCVGLQVVRGGGDKVYRAPPMLPSSSPPT